MPHRTLQTLLLSLPHTRYDVITTDIVNVTDLRGNDEADKCRCQNQHLLVHRHRDTLKPLLCEVKVMLARKQIEQNLKCFITKYKNSIYSNFF